MLYSVYKVDIVTKPCPSLHKRNIRSDWDAHGCASATSSFIKFHIFVTQTVSIRDLYNVGFPSTTVSNKQEKVYEHIFNS